MRQRNWLFLKRKLVTTTDLDFSFQAVQQHLGYITRAFFNHGVMSTTQYPNPFPVTLDNGQLTGSVGNGIAFDSNGMLVRIGTSSTSPRVFSITQSNVTYDRWDLLVLRYKQGSDTLIQSPSNALQTVALNLHDDFELLVRAGAPAGTPTYPAKTAGDVILAGLRVPANATSASQVTLDLGIRELTQTAASLRAEIVNETLQGTVDGANTAFQLSKPPLSAQGVAVFLDSLKLEPADYTIVTQNLTLTDPPQLGQTVSAYYVANSAATTNPLASVTELASGTADGSNRLFSLTGRPADKASTLVFVNGLASDAGDWLLVQGVSSGAIQFNPDQAPQPGQTVSVLYFVNPATVGIAGQNQGSSGGTGGGSGSTPEVEYPTLGASDIANGYIDLLHVPADPTKVLFDIIGGGPQVYGVDFSVSGQRLTLSGEFADADGAFPLQAGDRLRIVYWI